MSTMNRDKITGISIQKNKLGENILLGPVLQTKLQSEVIANERSERSNLRKDSILMYIKKLLGHNHSKTTETYTLVTKRSLSWIRSPLDFIKVREGVSPYEK